MFLIVVNTNAWARGETLAEAFQNLFHHTTRPPTAGIIYEYEAENEADVYVDELGWVRAAESAEILKEKHFSPQEIFRIHDELQYKIDGVLYS